MGQSSRSWRPKTIIDLDDACLAEVLSNLDPLPDLFNAARACTRFRDLLHTRCSWLIVGQELSPSPPAALPRCRARFLTLAEAVATSRPGDTILLEPTPPGRPHDAAGIAIIHPLRLLGGGAAPGDCVLSCSVQGIPALIFNASSRIFNLTIEGDGLAGAVAHHGGRLQIEDCEVHCCARGLPHLAAPLVCMAAAPQNGSKVIDEATARGAGLVIPVDLQGCSGGLVSPQMTVPTPLQRQTGCRHGPGTVAVAGCSLEGGARAVRLRGGATLREVRVVYEAHKALFWFEVEAGSGGEGETREGPGGGAPAGGLLDAPAAGPSWMRSADARKFDPQSLQAHIDAMVEGAVAPPPLPPPPPLPLPNGGVDVEKKAQAWRAGHRTAYQAPISGEPKPSAGP